MSAGESNSLLPQHTELVRSRTAVKRHRYQGERPPSEDRQSRSAGRHVTRRRVSHVVRTNVSELAFRVQKSIVRPDIADV